MKVSDEPAESHGHPGEPCEVGEVDGAVVTCMQSWLGWTERPQHDEDQRCVCVYEHRPPYLELERHRILPGYLGGTYDADNIAWICGTSHASVHEIQRLMLRDHVLYTYRQVQDISTRPVSRYAYDLAAEGYRRWLATQPAPTS